MNQRMLEIYNEIDLLILDILGPVRISKSINRAAFDKLYIKLAELAEVVQSEGAIPVKIAGQLFIIYTSMIGEVSHASYPDPLFMEVSKLESCIAKVYGC